ncbi:hypothetical protein [Litorilituus lipolyticus]|uniref:Uncharacterized protein n=1 Tax=Litorilituus lipolyticus TaxID=2491017 RepID=A0A502L459_9GAMM|nr:hypothetical protein [Litorilituus lipolyticus]TPH18496.1 hypothetical protein EPA86_01660 [Litorilituus lipolyticus]
MDIKLMDSCEDLFCYPPEESKKWFQQRPERTAYLAVTQFTYMGVLYEQLLVTRDWAIPVRLEPTQKKKLKHLSSYSPAKEEFDIYIALSSIGIIMLGYLNKKNNL